MTSRRQIIRGTVAARPPILRYWSEQSDPCYQQGEMSCLSCHSMHDENPSDQLAARLDVDDACLHCHDDLRSSVIEHTHHPAGSPGSRCVNCHMPYTTYALFKSIRSHRIDSPRAGASGDGAKPNACNLCHLDQTLAWTSEALTDWYGQSEVELNADERSIAASLLWMHSGDAAQRVVTAAAAGKAREVSGTEWLAPHLAELLNDPYSAVRLVSWRSLKTLVGEEPGYDFLAPEAERLAARDQIQSNWRAARSAPPQEFLRKLLYVEGGELDRLGLLRLREQRDDRPIRIAE